MSEELATITIVTADGYHFSVIEEPALGWIVGIEFVVGRVANGQAAGQRQQNGEQHDRIVSRFDRNSVGSSEIQRFSSNSPDWETRLGWSCFSSLMKWIPSLHRNITNGCHNTVSLLKNSISDFASSSRLFYQLFCIFTNRTKYHMQKVSIDGLNNNN